jgi:hypothetical protein
MVYGPSRGPLPVNPATGSADFNLIFYELLMASREKEPVKQEAVDKQSLIVCPGHFREALLFRQLVNGKIL